MIDQDTLIRETLERLRDVRAEVHDDVERSVIKQLDEAIWMLEETQCNERVELSLHEVLKLLGKVIEVLPAMAQLLVLLRDCR
jgi:hypothetical protein